jgi:hypothetical protein
MLQLDLGFRVSVSFFSCLLIDILIALNLRQAYYQIMPQLNGGFWVLGFLFLLLFADMFSDLKSP